MMIDAKTRDIYVNEINTIPGSLSFYLWKPVGIDFTERAYGTPGKTRTQAQTRAERKTVSYDANIFAMGGGVKGAKGAKCAKY